MKNLGTVDYTLPVPPKGYRCMDCDAHGVKLWRMGASSCIEFRCLDCALKNQKTQASPSPDGKGVLCERYGRERQTDQIGGLVPAVPVPEGDTCWGYTSVPQEACEWWWSLPYFREDAERIQKKVGIK